MKTGTTRKVAVAAASLLLVAEAAVLSSRRGFLFGAKTYVRCLRGHIFSTLWIPGVSFKAIRLGWWRVQYCPVDRHWSLVTPVRASELTEQERITADLNPDVRVP